MDERRFLHALIDAAIDRIESSVPPCVDAEESVEESSVSYRHGVLEVTGETLVTLYGGPDLYGIHTLLSACGLHQAVERWVNARLADHSAERPQAGPIVEKILSLKRDDE